MERPAVFMARYNRALDKTWKGEIHRISYKQIQ